MTAANVLFDQREATIINDSLMYHPDGTPAGYGQKCITFPHYRTAVTGCGSLPFLTMLTHQVQTSLIPGDSVDGILACLSGLLAKTDEWLSDCDTDAVRVNQIFIVGWSNAKNAIACTTAKRMPGETAFRIEALQPALHMAPAITPADLPEPVKPGGQQDPVKAFVNIVKGQRAVMERDFPQFPLGGAVVMTKVNKFGIEQKVIHRFADEFPAHVRIATAA